MIDSPLRYRLRFIFENFLFIGFLITLFSGMLFAADATSYRLLYVDSYRPGNRWSDDLREGLREGLKEELGDLFSLFIEYLDAEHFGEALKGRLGEQTLSLWEEKYGRTPPDLILVSDQDGYDLLKRARASFFPTTPIVFSGVESLGTIPPYTTGILSTVNISGNLKLIADLMPAAERIWVVTGRSATGHSLRQEIESIAKTLPSPVSLSFFDEGEGVLPEALIDKSRKLKPSDPVFFLDYDENPQGRSIDMATLLSSMTAACPAPIFSHVQYHLDYGIVGGIMNSPEIQGKQMAAIAAGVLRKRVPPDAPPQREETTPYFDLEAVKKHNIPVRKLPDRTEWVDHSNGFWKAYGVYVVAAILFIAFQTGFILLLFRLYRKQRLLKMETSQNELLFRSLFDLAPYACALQDYEGRHLMVNQAFLKDWGMEKRDVIGKSMAELLGKPYQEALEEDRAALLEQGYVEHKRLTVEIPGKGARETYYSSQLIQLNDTPHFLSVSVDLSEFRNTEKRYWEEREFNQLLLDTSPAFIVAIGFDGRTLMMNRALLDFLEFEAEEILGKDYLTTFVPPEDRETLENIFKSHADGMETTLNENRIVSRSGKTTLVEWYGRNVKKAENAPSFFIGVGIDITDRKRVENALKENEMRAVRQRAAVVKLALSPASDLTNLSKSFERVTEVVSNALGVERTSIWQVTGDGRTLRCLSLYEAGKKKHSQMPPIDLRTIPFYWETIKTENRIYADDALNDPRTAELTDSFILPYRITSMLDAGILVEGKLIGVISCSQTREKRHWHLDEEAFVSTIAAFIGQNLSNIDRKQAEKALLETQEQIRKQQGKFQKELLRSIIQILELYDLYTSGHSENVAHYSALIAEQVKLDSSWIKQVYWAGLVHDIGKLLVPTRILNKPSRLTDDEYELVKMHPVWGAKVLMTSEQLNEIGVYVRHHHERYDGKGYPDGLSGTRIPLASRIIAVADAYDAMISERSYRTPYSVERAKEELSRNKGTQFDPDLVDVFLSIIEKSGRAKGKDRSTAYDNR